MVLIPSLNICDSEIMLCLLIKLHSRNLGWEGESRRVKINLVMSIYKNNILTAAYIYGQFIMSEVVLSTSHLILTVKVEMIISLVLHMRKLRHRM